MKNSKKILNINMRRVKTQEPAGLSDEEYETYRDMECLRMWRFPWGLWIMSFICFIAGSFLVASLTVLELIDGFDGSIWQYCVILFFFFFAGLFFINAKIEILTFDKETKYMYKTKRIVCFKWKEIAFPLDDILDINIMLSGIEAKYSSTLYYKISIITRKNKPISVLETKNMKSVINKALKIRAFFNMKGKIPLNDISKTE